MRSPLLWQLHMFFLLYGDSVAGQDVRIAHAVQAVVVFLLQTFPKLVRQLRAILFLGLVPGLALLIQLHRAFIVVLDCIKLLMGWFVAMDRLDVMRQFLVRVKLIHR